MKTFKCIVHTEDDEIIEINVVEDQLLLPQLENNNIAINNDCRDGVCGACTVNLIKGQVLDQYGELKTESDSKTIKPCVCYPQSDLEIQLLD